MPETEKRIKDIETMAGASAEDNQIALIKALCEVARQLAQLRYLYEFELGIEDERTSPVRQKTPVREYKVGGKDED